MIVGEYQDIQSNIIQTEGSYELMNDCRGIPRDSK